MIRKSVETRDWLHTLEPRSVRSVMKRVVEEVTLLDKQVSTLYEDGTKKEQGSGIAWLLPLLCLFALGSALMYVRIARNTFAGESIATVCESLLQIYLCGTIFV